MFYRKPLLIAFVVLMLAGCTAPIAAPNAAPVEAAAVLTEAASAPTEAAAVPTIDVTTLPRDVDVQTTAALRSQPNVVILDVREQSEWDGGHIPGALFIPMNDVPNRLKEIPTDKTVIVQCRSGNRSGSVTEYLRNLGMNNVHNMSGGLKAWEAAGLPVEK